MPAYSPTLAGFRAAFRRPSLTFAEISWRWTLGATAIALFLFSCVEYLKTLPVSNADLALLSTRQPALVGRALAHIVHGSLNRTVLAASVAAIAVALLWIAASSVGRYLTVRALVEIFREGGFGGGLHGALLDTANEQAAGAERLATKRHPVRALVHLNFLRVAVVLALLLSILGASILSGFASTAAHPRPGLAILLFFPLAAIVLLAGWSLNWWLSLAAIFAVENKQGALDAIADAVAFSRERTGAILAVSTWTGLAHIVAFSLATTAVSFPLAFLQIVPPRIVLAAIVLITLVYFAVADWLYMARLAGYVYIAGHPIETPPPAIVPPVSPALVNTIDRSELILSDLLTSDLPTSDLPTGDLPNLAVEG